MTNLSVNINKVATLRNARGENVPDVERVAVDCETFGAQGITVHPRPDERHIKHEDVFALRPLIKTEFNIEGYPSPEFMDLGLTVNKTGGDRVELYTKPYADMYPSDPEKAVAPYVEASKAAHNCGLGVNAGHDLNLANLRYFHEKVPYLNEVSIGHAIIADALYLGLKETIKQYKECLS